MNIPPDDLIKILSSKNKQEKQQTAMKMLDQLDAEQSRQVKSIMQDEQKLKNILASPEAQQLISKLKGNKNG